MDKWSKGNLLVLLFFVLILSSCAPAIRYSASSETRSAKSADYSIQAFEENDPLPENAVSLGEMTLGDTGFTAFGCDFNSLLNRAEEKARAVGGDAVKIVMKKRPDILSSCYRIKVKIIAFK
ncbi:MAG: hypothetical protein HY210_06945 [Candidatus Omnitrophica bacterium]|nr:hypothetical protein [Candidatus Omnitrophota bacterium]